MVSIRRGHDRITYYIGAIGAVTADAGLHLLHFSPAIGAALVLRQKRLSGGMRNKIGG